MQTLCGEDVNRPKEAAFLWNNLHNDHQGHWSRPFTLPRSDYLPQKANSAMTRSRVRSLLALIALVGPSALPVRSAEQLDIASFSRVITCDPARIKGTQAKRLEEFPADDLFLESEIRSNEAGGYEVPSWQNGMSCIGLQWAERRVLSSVSLQFDGAAPDVPTESVSVQYWSSEGRVDEWATIGQTLWQGKWESLPGTLRREDNRWVLQIAADVPEFQNRSGTQKIRWFFPASSQQAVVTKLTAITDAELVTGRFTLRCDRAFSEGGVSVEAYNSFFVSPDGTLATRQDWDARHPLEVQLQYATPPASANRAVVRLRFPHVAFAVNVQDILTHGCVYVPDAELFVAAESMQAGPAQYKEKIAGLQTTLDQVRALPDQTFERAKATLLDSRSAHDPILLSLACDNAKIVVQRNGVLDIPKTWSVEDTYEITPRMGTGNTDTLRRHLKGGWLPIPVITWEDADARYTQRTCVAPVDVTGSLGDSGAMATAKSLGVTELSVKNTTDHQVVASLTITCASKSRPEGAADYVRTPMADMRSAAGGVIILQGNELFALVDTAGLPQWHVEVTAGTIAMRGPVAVGADAACRIYVPRWSVKPEDFTPPADTDQLIGATRVYWEQQLALAMSISVPEPMLNHILRANQVHLMMAARSEADGAHIVPWCAAMTYGPLDTEAQPVILALDLFGHHDLARKSLDYFFSRYDTRGCLANGYTLMGTGQNLWTVGQHLKLTDDRSWFANAAPVARRACEWIIDQRSKTMKLDVRGEKVPEYGLMPPGVLADWERYAYYFYANGYYYAGLNAMADALSSIHDARAPELVRSAESYRNDILRAYRWNQARMPVLPLADGTWVPANPSSLYCFGLTKDFYQGISSIGHDVEVGSNHLLELGVLESRGNDARWITNYMEDAWFFFHPGLANYAPDVMQNDWFTYGGFTKLQPYYTRYADVLAQADDIKPFIRNYFNSFFPMLSPETLALWEHFHQIGAWNKTHETAWFLQQTRTMLVMERGDELWLAPFVTDNWLQDGMSVSVRNAPSYFGPVSYTISSHLADHYIEAAIEPPQRRACRLVIRLRNPAGKSPHTVLVNGEPRTFDSVRQCIEIGEASGPLVLRASY